MCLREIEKFEFEVKESCFFFVNSGEIDESIIWKLKQSPTVRGVVMAKHLVLNPFKMCRKHTLNR